MSNYPTTLRPDSLATLGDGNTTLATPLTEAPVDFPVMRRIAAADREVTALRQLLAQGRAVTDADLARVSGLIRGEARGVWLGRPPTDEEVAAHVREHGADAVWVSACHNGSVWVSSAVGVYPLSLGDLGADLTVIDAAPAVGRADAERLGRERMEREKAKRP